MSSATVASVRLMRQEQGKRDDGMVGEEMENSVTNGLAGGLVENMGHARLQQNAARIQQLRGKKAEEGD